MIQILSRYAREYLADRLSGSENPLKISGIPAGSFAFVVSALLAHLSGPASETPKKKGASKKKKSICQSILVVAQSNQEAENLARDAAFFIGEANVVYLPGYEGIPYEFSGWSYEITRERIRGLYRILSRDQVIVFTSPEGMLRKMPSPERFAGQALELKTDTEYSMDRLVASLTELGYNRVDRVDLPGDFCKKGSVIDVFPPNLQNPVRIDYFDDLIETIRYFESDSQIAVNRVDSVEILPAGEVVLTKEESEALIDILSDNDRFPAILQRPSWFDVNGSHSSLNMSQNLNPGVEDLFPLVMDTCSLSQFFPDEPITVLIRPDRIETRYEQINREFDTVYKKELDHRVTIEPDILLDRDGIPFEPETSARTIFVSDLGFDTPAQTDGEGDSMVQQSPTEIWGIKQSPAFLGRIRDVRETLVKLRGEGGKVIIVSSFSAQINRVAGIFRTEKGLPVRIYENESDLFTQNLNEDTDNPIRVIRGNLREGFWIPGESLYFWSDGDIFGRSYRRKRKFKSSSSTPIESFLDLKENDYVVHVNHGIGQFVALERVKAAGRARDFLVLEYADQDRLFVPLDQISLIQKYSSPVEAPKLDSLGKASFKKIRERVEKRVEEFAQELIKIYAVRMSRKGYQFPPDTGWQEEFESEFPFEETPDQLAAIESVTRDMESERPMDRLICGDVGYGKTEVAIRAAFKAVMSGKQVVLIAPTTILAMQHFRSFSERYQNYPIKVDWISRFRTRGETQSVKKALRSGDVDIVIGTHALLSKDFYIKNLGLLIVDEEQRFGVAQKEAVKNVKKLVDVLTMSATPIPRTLHMSMVGIRDISIIQTPPRDRLPVRTYAMEDSDTVLIEAVQREVERGGQAFFLHNRVETIEAAAERVRSLLPELSIAVLHGQMHEDEIEDILMDFLEKKYDLLVTTTIIESGIDMPNVNTLVVDRADMFGLAQLYQIRGRVGRSNRQAYAYLFYPSGRVLTEQAQKRISTILEYQELGSGFKVSMRDLEIRGAGNVLGKEQSGDIIDVGYELYVKLLDDAVKKLKGEEVEVEIRTTINLKTDFYLPEDYITDVRQRIEFYKRLEACKHLSEVERCRNEMENRFGKPPRIAEIFILIEKIRTLSSKAGFESVYEDDRGRICFKAGENFRIPPPHLIEMLQKDPDLSVEPGNTDTLFYSGPGEGEKALPGIVEMLVRLLGPLMDEEQDEQTGHEGPGVTRVR